MVFLTRLATVAAVDIDVIDVADGTLWANAVYGSSSAYTVTNTAVKLFFVYLVDIIVVLSRFATVPVVHLQYMSRCIAVVGQTVSQAS